MQGDLEDQTSLWKLFRALFTYFTYPDIRRFDVIKFLFLTAGIQKGLKLPNYEIKISKIFILYL